MITVFKLYDINPFLPSVLFDLYKGLSGGAMVPGKLRLPGRLTNLIIVGQGPIALAIGADGGVVSLKRILVKLTNSQFFLRQND